MMQSKTVQIWVGIFIALGFAALFMLAMKVSNLSSFTDDDGYEITASFENIGGLKVRSPIKMAGVIVGRVAKINFDNINYEAVVTMSINARYNKMPADTSASIFTSGLLGEQYIGLEAGGDENYLKQDDELQLTQSAMILENLIGQFVFDKASEEKQ
jgi:phospholipid/cholesterol/gamma-HCH transport system substrate-binding protein